MARLELLSDAVGSSRRAKKPPASAPLPHRQRGACHSALLPTLIHADAPQAQPWATQLCLPASLRAPPPASPPLAVSWLGPASRVSGLRRPAAPRSVAEAEAEALTFYSACSVAGPLGCFRYAIGDFVHVAVPVGGPLQPLPGREAPLQVAQLTSLFESRREGPAAAPEGGAAAVSPRGSGWMRVRRLVGHEELQRAPPQPPLPNELYLTDTYGEWPLSFLGPPAVVLLSRPPIPAIDNSAADASASLPSAPPPFLCRYLYLPHSAGPSSFVPVSPPGASSLPPALLAATLLEAPPAPSLPSPSSDGAGSSSSAPCELQLSLGPRWPSPPAPVPATPTTPASQQGPKAAGLPPVPSAQQQQQQQSSLIARGRLQAEAALAAACCGPVSAAPPWPLLCLPWQLAGKNRGAPGKAPPAAKTPQGTAAGSSLAGAAAAQSHPVTPPHASVSPEHGAPGHGEQRERTVARVVAARRSLQPALAAAASVGQGSVTEAPQQATSRAAEGAASPKKAQQKPCSGNASGTQLLGTTQQGAQLAAGHRGAAAPSHSETPPAAADKWQSLFLASSMLSSIAASGPPPPPPSPCDEGRGSGGEKGTADAASLLVGRMGGLAGFASAAATTDIGADAEDCEMAGGGEGYSASVALALLKGGQEGAGQTWLSAASGTKPGRAPGGAAAGAGNAAAAAAAVVAASASKAGSLLKASPGWASAESVTAAAKASGEREEEHEGAGRGSSGARREQQQQQQQLLHDAGKETAGASARGAGAQAVFLGSVPPGKAEASAAAILLEAGAVGGPASAAAAWPKGRRAAAAGRPARKRGAGAALRAAVVAEPEVGSDEEGEEPPRETEEGGSRKRRRTQRGAGQEGPSDASASAASSRSSSMSGAGQPAAVARSDSRMRSRRKAAAGGQAAPGRAAAPAAKKKRVQQRHGRWSKARFEAAQASLVAIMQGHGARPERPLLRAVLRKEARRSVGDTGLLDHLLRHMADAEVAPGLVFRRQFNPQGAMEYWLEDEEEEEGGEGEEWEEEEDAKGCAGPHVGGAAGGARGRGSGPRGGAAGAPAASAAGCRCCSSGCAGVSALEGELGSLRALVAQLQRDVEHLSEAVQPGQPLWPPLSTLTAAAMASAAPAGDAGTRGRSSEEDEEEEEEEEEEEQERARVGE